MLPCGNGPDIVPYLKCLPLKYLMRSAIPLSWKLIVFTHGVEKEFRKMKNIYDFRTTWHVLTYCAAGIAIEIAKVSS